MSITLALRSRVGPKGQAVIPKPIRDALGIHAGDEVYYTLHGSHVHVEKGAPGERLREFFRSLPDRQGERTLGLAELKRIRDEQYEEEFGGG